MSRQREGCLGREDHNEAKDSCHQFQCKHIYVAQQKHEHESLHKFESVSMNKCEVCQQYTNATKVPVQSKNVEGRRKHCSDVMY